MTYTLSTAERQQYREQGYFIRQGIIAPDDIEALKSDIESLLERSLANQGPELRWINKEKRIPNRLGQLLRPGWVQPSFVDSLEHGPYIPIAEQILEGPVRYGAFGMLAGGDGRAYIQDWHRDAAPVEGDQQMSILERGYWKGVQINAPLFPDRFLTIVPGSHLRPTTEAEREVLKYNPKGDMPGQMTVELEPGDVVFYYPNFLHRGYNPSGEIRWTMHHSFMNINYPVWAQERGQEEWIGQPDYLESLPPAARLFMQRFLDAVPDGDSPPQAS
jgi:hypothetical protein